MEHAEYVHKRSAPDPPGISDEVRDHAVAVHRAECPDATFRWLWCECGRSMAVACKRCRAVLFVAAGPGQLCRHALWLLER
jgi:hypothetical protein